MSPPLRPVDERGRAVTVERRRVASLPPGRDRGSCTVYSGQRSLSQPPAAELAAIAMLHTPPDSPCSRPMEADSDPTECQLVRGSGRGSPYVHLHEPYAALGEQPSVAALANRISPLPVFSSMSTWFADPSQGIEWARSTLQRSALGNVTHLKLDLTPEYLSADPASWTQRVGGLGYGMFQDEFARFAGSAIASFAKAGGRLSLAVELGALHGSSTLAWRHGLGWNQTCDVLERGGPCPPPRSSLRSIRVVASDASACALRYGLSQGFFDQAVVTDLNDEPNPRLAAALRGTDLAVCIMATSYLNEERWRQLCTHFLADRSRPKLLLYNVLCAFDERELSPAALFCSVPDWRADRAFIRHRRFASKEVSARGGGREAWTMLYAVHFAPITTAHIAPSAEPQVLQYRLRPQRAPAEQVPQAAAAVDDLSEPPPLLKGTCLVEFKAGRLRPCLLPMHQEFEPDSCVIIEDRAGGAEERAAVRAIAIIRSGDIDIGDSPLIGRIVRPATVEEETIWRRAASDEQTALGWLRWRVAALQLAITVHGVELQQLLDNPSDEREWKVTCGGGSAEPEAGSRTRLLVHYTTDAKRVNFVKLLHDGFRRFRCRVWLNNARPRSGAPGESIEVESLPEDPVPCSLRFQSGGLPGLQPEPDSQVAMQQLRRFADFYKPLKFARPKHDFFPHYVAPDPREWGRVMVSLDYGLFHNSFVDMSRSMLCGFLRHIATDAEGQGLPVPTEVECVELGAQHGAGTLGYKWGMRWEQVVNFWNNPRAPVHGEPLPIRVTACDVSTPALLYGQRRGVFDSTVQQDFNRNLDPSVEMLLRSAQICVCIMATHYTRDGAWMRLCNDVFLADRSRRKMLIYNQLCPFDDRAMSPAEIFKGVPGWSSWSKFVKHRDFAPEEREAQLGATESWTYLYVILFDPLPGPEVP